MMCFFILGVSSLTICEGQLSELESILDSKVKMLFTCGFNLYACGLLPSDLSQTGIYIIIVLNFVNSDVYCGGQKSNGSLCS